MPVVSGPPRYDQITPMEPPRYTPEDPCKLPVYGEPDVDSKVEQIHPKSESDVNVQMEGTSTQNGLSESVNVALEMNSSSTGQISNQTTSDQTH